MAVSTSITGALLYYYMHINFIVKNNENPDESYINRYYVGIKFNMISNKKIKEHV